MAQNINVDVTPNLFQPTLYYHQGDIGRAFTITISTKDGYTIPSGATVKIEATKPSGLGFSVSGTLSGNVVSFVSTEGMTDEYGRFPAQLKITSGNDILYTANFLMVGAINTHPASVTDGTAEQVISEITLLVERAETAASTAATDAANAAQARVDEMMDYLPSEVADLKSAKVPYPIDPDSKYGTSGQVLRTKGNGATEWASVGLPTDEQTAQAVSDWLDDHPEATTTVQDGSLTEAKFSDALKLKAIKDYVTPQMFGAKGDGITDDTSAFTQLNGKTAYIPEGTYLISNLTYGSNTSLNGAGMGKTILKQTSNNDDDFITFLNARNCKLNNVTLTGRKDEVGEMTHTYIFQALLKIRNNYHELHISDYNVFEHIAINNACVNGLVLNGLNSNADGFDSKHRDNSWNWVHHFNDFRIENCDRYCFIDQSSDNLFSNFYISEGNVANAFINASSNMYVNFKIDQPEGGGAKGDSANWREGCLLAVQGSNALRMINFDLQSAYYCGAKFSYSNNIRFDGLVNNCGIGNQNGVGIAIGECNYFDFNVEFHDVSGYQLKNLDINQYCTYINCFIKEQNKATATHSNGSPDTCIIADVCDLASLFNIGSVTLLKNTAYVFGSNVDYMKEAIIYLIRGKIDGLFIMFGTNGCIVGFSDKANSNGYAMQLSHLARYKCTFTASDVTTVSD